MNADGQKFKDAIIEFLPDPTFVIDLNGKVIMWNSAMEMLTSIPRDAILGRDNYEYAIPFYKKRRPMLADLIFMPGEELEKKYDTVQRVGDTLVVEIYIPDFNKVGAYLWAKASPLYDSNGEIVGSIETIRDITEQKKAEQQVLQSQRSLSDILSFLPDATFVIDLEGKVIAWNSAMEMLTSIPAAAIIGKGDYEYALPFYKKRRPMLADLIFLPESELENKYNTVKRDGDTLVVDVFIPDFKEGGAWFWAKATPMFNSQGEVVGAIETIRDITDRKQAEEEIEKSKRNLADILSFLPDATLVIDSKGKVIAWNGAMEMLTSIPAEAMIGKDNYEYALPFYKKRRPMLADLIFLPETELENKYNTVERVGDTLVADVFIPDFKPGGAYFWAKASPLYDPSSGSVVGAIETVRDITERREMEGRLARSNAELQIAAEIQKSFLPDTIPNITGFDVAARTVMAKEVGGDFFDVIPYEIMAFDEGRHGLLVADVAGKGVPAALFMALSRVVVRVNALWHKDPAKVIYNSNNTIAQDAKSGMFVTLFFGMLNKKDRSLTYVNAGHNPPLVYRSQSRTIEKLLPTGIVLGVMEDQDYESKTVTIGKDDIIVMYTDGVTESINKQEELFGEKRLIELIQSNAHLPAQAMLEKILSAVDGFADGMPQFDDMTMLIIKGT
jgi:PAS domain S-box-containing protein